MPDTHVGESYARLAVARSSLRGLLANVRPPGSAFSLVMVGLMGEPPLFRPDVRERNWLARTRASILGLFRGQRRSRRVVPDARTGGPSEAWDDRPGASATRYLCAALLVAAATVVCLVLQPFLLDGSLVLPFLIAIVLTSVAYGLLPSLFASVLSVLTFDYLFLPPFYSLTVSDPDDVLRLVVFGLTALIVSNLAAYARNQAVTASRRAQVAEDLYRFGRQLTGAATLREVLDVARSRIAEIVKARVQIVLPDGDDLGRPPDRGQPDRAGASDTSGTEFADTDFTNVKSWLRCDILAGLDTHVPESARWLFVPMRAAHGNVGVLAIARDDPRGLRMPNSEALFGTVADLLAQSIDRIRLVDDLNRASRAAAREDLHAALLASLSHDLRSPLASVLGTAESLMALNGQLGAEKRQELTRSIQDDARQLDRYIGNLLDMTRLEAGLADASTSRIDLADVVNVALDRCSETLSGHRVSVMLESELPLLAGDEVLLEHVLFNLFENAAKYTPRGTLIQLRAFRDAAHVVVEILDEGEGIDPLELERIFDKFYRARRQGAPRPGIGLGLAICLGYVAAMDGQISARNRTDRGGTAFTITLPVPADEDLPDGSA